MFRVNLDTSASEGGARSATATTHRGTYNTPCFMPVGTRGAIKYLSARDYAELGAQIVLGNTYHLMLRPGAEVIEQFGGLGAFRFFHWTQRLTMMELHSNQRMTVLTIALLLK